MQKSVLQSWMKALCIRQPFAWLVATGAKPIENRTWRTKHRGPLLILAATKMHAMPIAQIEERYGVSIDRAALLFGGAIALVDLVDVVTRSDSTWFDGPFGFVLANPIPIPLVPISGRQLIFNVPDIVT
jgi:hypothetical protein